MDEVGQAFLPVPASRMINKVRPHITQNESLSV